MSKAPVSLAEEPLRSAKEAITREETAGLSFMLWGRLAVLGILAGWVVLAVPDERLFLYLSLICGFALFGTLPYLLARKGIGGVALITALLALEAGALSYILIVPMPFDIEAWTPQLNLRLPGFLYLGLLLVSMALSYSPLLVMGAGLACITAWSAGYLWVANLPESVLMWPLDLLDEKVSSEAFIAQYLDPHVVRPNFFLNQIAFLSAVTVVLALTVSRSRNLVRRVLSAEWEREAALAQQHFIRETFGRFVPDTVVSQILSDRGRLLPKKRLATVLFADLEGFTALSKRLSPEMLLRVLNEYFEEAGTIITDHGGTITQFQGDALLASFNVPVDDERHALHAVHAAQALVSMVAAKLFEGERLRVRIGINTGDVASGAVGGTDRLTYTIHGECVNVAARLESQNKQTGTQILLTHATAADVGTQVDLLSVGKVEVRGIPDPVDLFTVA